MTCFDPKMSILPEPQLALWPELQQTPDDFVLYGGTALALRLGHRQSIDFDFFSNQAFDPDRLYDSVPYLEGSEVMQKDQSTLTCLVYRLDEPVMLSFFGLPKLGLVSAPQPTCDGVLKAASLLDLAGTKVSVVQKRAAWKDYADIYAILTNTDISLETALAAGKVLYGTGFDAHISLKALSYFDDGDLATLDQNIIDNLLGAVSEVDLEAIPNLSYIKAAP